jgi:DNA-binding transcriptional regulator Cro
MTPQDVLNKYGSQYQFHKQTGMSHTSLGHWLKLGYVPEASQYKLEVITNGELKTQWTQDKEKEQ